MLLLHLIDGVEHAPLGKQVSKAGGGLAEGHLVLAGKLLHLILEQVLEAAVFELVKLIEHCDHIVTLYFSCRMTVLLLFRQLLHHRLSF